MHDMHPALPIHDEPALAVRHDDCGFARNVFIVYCIRRSKQPLQLCAHVFADIHVQTNGIWPAASVA
eukprot:5472592-Pleurochrysis_carterae.AAC.4